MLKFIHNSDNFVHVFWNESVVLAPDVLSSVRKISKRVLTSVLEPGPGGGDVVSGTLALDLDEDPHVSQEGPEKN